MSLTDRRVRVLIADDQPAIRNVVRSALEEHPRFEVCGEVADGVRAVEEAVRLRPDVVVLDISMPVLDGLSAARSIKARLPESAIIILSSNADRDIVDAAKKLGVRAYVVKIQLWQALVEAIDGAMRGNDFVLMG